MKRKLGILCATVLLPLGFILPSYAAIEDEIPCENLSVYFYMAVLYRDEGANIKQNMEKGLLVAKQVPETNKDLPTFTALYARILHQVYSSKKAYSLGPEFVRVASKHNCMSVGAVNFINEITPK